MTGMRVGPKVARVPTLPASLTLWLCPMGHEVYSRHELTDCPAFSCGRPLTPKGRRR